MPQLVPVIDAPAELEINSVADVRYVAFLSDLENLRKQVKDDGMNGQIDRLSNVVRQINVFAEEKPDCWRLIDKKIADYYFPTALKLIGTYIESYPMQTDTNEIKKIIDGITPAIGGIISALENQLDALYRAKSVDVAADINVLNHMLMIDGVEIERKNEVKG